MVGAQEIKLFGGGSGVGGGFIELFIYGGGVGSIKLFGGGGGGGIRGFVKLFGGDGIRGYVGLFDGGGGVIFNSRGVGCSWFIIILKR